VRPQITGSSNRNELFVDRRCSGLDATVGPNFAILKNSSYTSRRPADLLSK